MKTCIDLKERFGRESRVVFEESYHAEMPEFRKEEAPWLRIIPCKHGEIFPWGGNRLAAFTDGRSVRKRLKALPVCETVFDGDFETICTFDVKDFESVAAVMRPKRRRRCYLSEEQKAKLALAGKKYRFAPSSAIGGCCAKVKNTGQNEPF